MRRTDQSPVSVEIAATVGRFAEILRDVADPKLIMLFGSHARGQAGPDSDIDLLVVQERDRWVAPSRWAEIDRLHSSLRPGLTPVDILLYTPDEMAKWKTARNHLIARALADGVVFYERP